MPKVIPLILLAGMLWSMAPTVAAEQTLEEKIDSLFVIASSGEVQFRDQNEPAMDSIAALGRVAVVPLIDKFSTRSARERWTVIWILQRIGSEAVPDLIAALSRPDGLIVQRVCWALGDIKDSTAVEPLIAVSDHQRWQVRDQVSRALGRIGDRRGLQTVLAAAGDSVGQVRKSAVVAAGQLGDPAAIPTLVRALDDNFYGARLMAKEALVLFDTASVVAEIALYLPRSAEEAGNLACAVLGQLASPEAIEILYRELASRSVSRRTSAALGLATADPLDNCGYLGPYLETESDFNSLLRVRSALPDTSHDSGQPQR